MPMQSLATVTLVSVSPPRRAVLWVLLWAVYVLLALGWFGYQDALDGLICRAPR